MDTYWRSIGLAYFAISEESIDLSVIVRLIDLMYWSSLISRVGIENQFKLIDMFGIIFSNDILCIQYTSFSEWFCQALNLKT